MSHRMCMLACKNMLKSLLYLTASGAQRGMSCEYTYILGALAKIHSGTLERSKRTRGDSTYVAGH